MSDTGSLQVTAPGKREIVMTRVFNSPRRLVFDAFTQPELLKRWFVDEVTQFDFRVGGAFQYVWDGPHGRFGQRGIFREIVEPEGIVYTAYAPGPPVEPEAATNLDVEEGALVTVRFDEADGATTMTLTMLFESQESRDAALESGMEHGAARSYEQLAALLALHQRRA